MRSARPPLASPSERNRPFSRSGNRGEGCRLSPVTINLSVSAYISVKIPRYRVELPKKGAVVGQPPSYKVHHFAFAFKHSLDAHQARAQQLAPLALDEMRPDDDINIAGLVLERYKYRSRGGARALAASDDARRARRSTAGEQLQLVGGSEAQARKARSQQGERMAPQGETGARVVGHDVLSLGWRRQNRRRFRHRRVAQDVCAGFDSRDLPVSLVPMAGERFERSGGGEASQVATVEFGAAGEILDVVERLVFPCRDDALGAGLRQALSQAEAQADRRVSICSGLQCAAPIAGQRIHRPYLDAVTARVLHELRRRVEAHRLTVDKRGEKRGRVVALDPGRTVGNQGEARRVRFGKAVFPEAENLAVDALGEFPGVVPFQHSVYQRLAETLDVAVAPPGGHGSAQLVGIARRKAGGDHGELHDLLLENRHAESALQHRFHRVARVLHRLDTVPPPQVRMHHVALDRPGPYDRDLDHEVVEVL